MNDTLVYSYLDVSISQNQIVANRKRYSLSSIILVEQRILKPRRWPGRLLMFGGLPLLFGRSNMPLFGALLMFLGVLHWRTAGVRYAVVIRTQTGEHQLLVSENSQDIENVISALNVAKSLNEIRGNNLP